LSHWSAPAAWARSNRARDTRLDRPVALKIVKPGWSDTEEGRRRFEREARVISKLNHPNVCAIYDVGLLPYVGRRRHPELACAPALTMGATGAAASQP
jgi:serine/threonine protein kinase